MDGQDAAGGEGLSRLRALNDQGQAAAERAASAVGRPGSWGDWRLGHRLNSFTVEPDGLVRRSERVEGITVARSYGEVALAVQFGDGPRQTLHLEPAQARALAELLTARAGEAEAGR